MIVDLNIQSYTVLQYRIKSTCLHIYYKIGVVKSSIEIIGKLCCRSLY